MELTLNNGGKFCLQRLQEEVILCLTRVDGVVIFLRGSELIGVL